MLGLIKKTGLTLLGALAISLGCGAAKADTLYVSAIAGPANVGGVQVLPTVNNSGADWTITYKMYEDGGGALQNGNGFAVAGLNYSSVTTTGIGSDFAYTSGGTFDGVTGGLTGTFNAGGTLYGPQAWTMTVTTNILSSVPVFFAAASYGTVDESVPVGNGYTDTRSNGTYILTSSFAPGDIPVSPLPATVWAGGLLIAGFAIVRKVMPKRIELMSVSFA
jgi:hypothetical protein